MAGTKTACLESVGELTCQEISLDLSGNWVDSL
jgi:hypothetical protein